MLEIRKAVCAAGLFVVALSGRTASDGLVSGFANPPDSARPQVWWHWMNGNVTKEGISADLEAFREKGIGGVHLFDVDYGIPKGPVTFNTPAWFDHVAWAAQEAKRLGLEITVCTGSGWCTGGGPWDKLEDGMRFTCWRETEVKGPTNGVIRLGLPKDARAYRDIAVMAYPKPAAGSAPAISDFPLKSLRLAFPGNTNGLPGSVGGLVSPAESVDLTGRMKPDGTLDWRVPAGEWCVLRLGSYVSGARSYPATAAGSGWEYDKLSKRVYDLHFDGYLKKLLDRLGPLAGKGPGGVTGLLLDSYEPGSQNWTDDLPAEFERIMGYSMKPYYPVLAGRVVTSIEVSERFLRDYRRVIADMFAHNFADHQVKRAHAYGLKVYHEPYGAPTPGDFLQYGQNADIPMSEYWAWDQGKSKLDGGSPIGGHIAHFWGKRIVAAESFTTWPTLAGWRQDPYSLKGWNDAGYVQGVNQVVYHGAVHQPWLDEHLFPGMTLGRFGVHFGRTVTWWPLAGEWIRYQMRCQFLLQEGTFRADVLAFAGDDAPKDTIPSVERMKGRPGYAFDAITREGLKAVRVRNGRLVSPGGVTYRLLHVGAREAMEPESLEAIARLVDAGATVVGRRPSKACGLRDYPRADAVVAKRAAEIWSKKNVIDSDSIDVGLKAIGLGPDWTLTGGDIRAIHRGYADGTEGYFVMNAAHRKAVTAKGVFRVTGLVPELWDAETGRITRVTDWTDNGTTTKLDIPLGPQGSVFVMFRPKDRVTAGAEPQTVRRTLSETDLSSGWKVSFPAGWGAPASIALDKLASWTTQADEGVRHFSGIATYEKTARISNYDPTRRYSLDLGNVKNLAEVTVNGKTYPSLWKPPFVLDITDAVKGPELNLSIRVANLWINRLIGDEEKPEDVTWTEKRWNGPHLANWPDWFLKKTPRTSGRLTFATWHHWKKGDALVDSGLLGPVKLREESVKTVASSGMERTTPESQGVSSEAVLRWIEACEQTAATNGFRHGFVHGFVIVRHGKVIAEGSWTPQDTLNVPHMLYSHSKSFTSTAVGFLVDDGKLDLDERVIDIFPDKAPVRPSENLRQLRVRDLLTMNVGADRTDSENDDVKGDWVRAFLANEIQRAPGTGFKYDSGATHLLAAIVEKKSGMRMMDFLGERLFRPLGMTSPWSTTSPTGVACGGWGMNMTTRDLAKFGQFLLQKGVWDGKRLLSSEWIDMASARQSWSGSIVVAAQTVGSGSDWAQGYGFQFWRCRHGAFRADGAAGQLTVVFPKEDAVVSVNAGLGDMQRELDLIWRHLLPAFGTDALPENEAALERLSRKCATLALPLDDAHPEVFADMDKATVECTADGWMLVKDCRRLMVGKDVWKVTDWTFTDDLVEPLFGDCGTRRIAAAGTVGTNGSIVVNWQMLGGIRHGSFTVTKRGRADVRSGRGHLRQRR